MLGSPVECGVQSKLLLLQFSGQANYRQRVEHSGMSIFNDLFSLIALSKQSGIKVSLLIELIENRRSPSFHHSDERLTLETLALETL